MSDSSFPYESPEQEIVPERPQAARAYLSDTMLRYLREASPWLRFLGILGFIGSGFMALFSLVFLAFSGAMSRLWDYIPGMYEYGSSLGSSYGVLMGILYIGMALLYFFPALFTFNFGFKLSGYFQSGSVQELETAFANNKSLWKFKGILAIISLATIPVAIIIFIIAAVAVAANFM